MAISVPVWHCVWASLWAVLCLSSLAAADDGKPALTALLGANAVLSLCATCVPFRCRGKTSQLPRWGAGALLIAGGFLSIFFQLVFRLLSAPAHFGGRVNSLDFGVKCDVKDGMYSLCVQNVAFVPEFNSFGHCIQGCFSLLLFPIINGSAGTRLSLQRLFPFLGPISQKALRVLQMLAHASSVFVIVYPVYNTLKRYIKHGSMFAASSYANNCTEWSMGFLLGLQTGHLLSLLAAAKVTNWSGSENSDDLLEAGEEASNPLHFLSCMKALHVGAGVLMVCTAAISGVLFGTTWNRTFTALNPDGAYDMQHGASPVVLVLMLCPVIAISSAAAFSQWQSGVKKTPTTERNSSTSTSRSSNISHTPAAQALSSDIF